jgi:glycosyltransferase involved in cell wall biosynthesis
LSLERTEGSEVAAAGVPRAGAGAAVAGRVAVVIPAYNPPPALEAWVAELVRGARVSAVVVVNDGSGAGCHTLFARLEAMAGVSVVHHSRNRGKGEALKTGLRHALQIRGLAGIVTADADGQHDVADILRVAERLVNEGSALVLGARRFDAATPARSRFGNRLTCLVLRFFTGMRLCDTQTGLRGIPLAMAPAFLHLRPHGYDYELDMLLAAARGRQRIVEEPIRTLYEPGNASSHFSPLLDSMKIYWVFLRFSAVSLLTAGLDNLVFSLVFLGGAEIAASQTVARVAAGSFQYAANRRGAFRSRISHWHALPRYWLTVAATGALSYLMIRLLNGGLGVPVIAAKLAAETLLFCVSFVALRVWVFRPDRGDS